MLLRIIRKEIVSHVLSLRFAATFVLFIVLVFASIYVAVNEYRRQSGEHDSLARTSRQRLDEALAEEDKGDAVNRVFWWEGKTDAVPVSPLSWIGQGVQSAYPAAIVTKADRTSRSMDRGLTRNPMLGSLRIPDYAYVVNVVLSLLAILFTFDAVCGEKESGTLRLVLSNAVPRHTVLLGKWIGGYVVLLVPFLVATAGGLVYALARGAIQAEHAPRIAFLVFVACLYIAVFFNVGLFISTTTSRSATSLLVCLLVWMISILAVPNLAPVTAKILAPTPSPDKIHSEKAAVQEEIDLRISRLTMTSGELSYGQKIEVEKLNLQKEAERRKRRWDQYYEERRRRQSNLAAALGRVSPSACWTYAAASLTNTGVDAYERFHSARRRLGEEFEKVYEDTRKTWRKDRSKGWPEITADELPNLRVRFPDAGEALGAALVDVLLLVILNVIFFMLGFTFFLRYDVR